MKRLFGSPAMRGQSEVVESAQWEAGAKPVVGAAITAVTDGAGLENQVSMKAFDGKSFGGFFVANDVNDKQRSGSFVKAGLDIAVKCAASKTFTQDSQLGLNAAGELIPADDGDCVFILNASVRSLAVKAFDNEMTAFDDQVSINLGFGGMPKP